MRRNFHSRVETMFPILDRTGRKAIESLLELCLQDQVKSWTLTSEGRYLRQPSSEQEALSSRSQIAIYEAVKSSRIFHSGPYEVVVNPQGEVERVEGQNSLLSRGPSR